MALLGVAAAIPGLKKISWFPAFLLLLVPLAAWATLIEATPAILNGANPSWNLAWYESIGVSLDLRLTPFTLWMAHIVLGIGNLVSIYALGYFEKRAKQMRFFSMLFAFMGAMTGLIMSDNLVLLFIFWELTSVLSFMMVGFYHNFEAARSGARRALLITAAGGLCLLAGLLLMGISVGTTRISELAPMGEALRQHPLAVPTMLLIMLGAFTKSAQFPFQFWLPGAMAAPTPASCYLHSAPMVKAGVFLLALLSPVYGGHPFWQFTLMGIGGITLLYGAWQSLFCLDLKAILANTTSAVLGLLVMLIGVGTPAALKALVLFTTGHALYKATLFMSAGIVDHHVGTRLLDRLSGLKRALPITSVAALLAALSMSGLPGTLGFVAKEYKYKSLLGMEGQLENFLLAGSVIASAMMILAALQVGLRPYSGKTSIQELDHVPGEKHHEGWGLTLPPTVLALTGILLGFFPGLGGKLFLSAATALSGETYAPIKLWHGFNAAFVLSLVTLSVGAALWYACHRFILSQKPPRGTRTFEKGLRSLFSGSKHVAGRFQFGSLRSDLIVMCLVTLALVMVKFVQDGIPISIPMDELKPLPIAFCVATIVGAVLACTAGTAKRAVLSMGACGFGTAMLFANFGAPDLAITQMSVDVLLCLLFMVALKKTPKTFGIDKKPHLWSLFVSVALGITLSLVVMKALSLDLAPSISRDLAEWSYPKAYGANVVNVILVDFRAMDTMGEITVLVIAVLGISALALRPTKKDEEVSS